jgi:hypothetical protein
MFASSSDLDDLERAIDKVIASEHPPLLELPRCVACWIGSMPRSWRPCVRTAKPGSCCARAGPSRPATRDAALAGEITPAHVRVLTNACTSPRAGAMQEHETKLVDFARRFTSRELHAVVRQLCDALEHRMASDPDRPHEPKRSRTQRRADALNDICRHYLATHHDLTTTRRCAHAPIGVVVDLEHLHR